MKRFSFPSPIAFREAPSVSLTLPDEAVRWCYGKMTVCFPDRLVFRSGPYEITLTGGDLRIGAMSESEIWIRGRILDLRIREAGL